MPDIYNSAINKISSCMLGVYLIHDNEIIRLVLWNKVFKLYSHYYSDDLLIYLIYIVIFVFAWCVIIDLIRQLIFEKIYMKIANKVYDKTENIFVKVKDKVFRQL